MLRKGSSWLGGLVLAGLLLGCTTGSETGEEPAVASEEAADQEEEAGREAAVTGRDHVIYLEAVEKPDDGTWGCKVDPAGTVWIESGDTVTFSGDRLPDPVVVETKVRIRPAPSKSGKPANTARPTNPPPYDVERGKPASMGAVTGAKGSFWIWAARFQFQASGGGPPEICNVDPVVCIGDPPPMGPEDENGGNVIGEEPGAESDPCQ